MIGFPIRVVVGKRGLAEGIVEIQMRRTGEVQKIAPEQAASKVKELISAGLKNERT